MAADVKQLPATVESITLDDGCIPLKSEYVTAVIVFKDVVDDGDVVLAATCDVTTAGSTRIKDK